MDPAMLRDRPVGEVGFQLQGHLDGATLVFVGLLVGFGLGCGARAGCEASRPLPLASEATFWYARHCDRISDETSEGPL